MSEFRMPSLGSDMDSGTLVEQAVSPGDTVRAGDVIGAVETQKGVIEIEVFQDGTFERWLADIGKTVPVGAPLALIRDSSDHPPPEVDTDAPAAARETAQKATPSTAETVRPQPETVAPPSRETALPASPDATPIKAKRPAAHRPRVTPAARRLAAQRGIDIASLAHGMARDSVITRRDIEAQTDAATPQETKTVTTDFRSAIAAAMSRSKREIPHYYLSHDVDLSAIDAFVSEVNADRAPSDRILNGAVCAKAVAVALAKYPEFNGHYIDNAFRAADAVHLGFAINIRSGGLVAPALFDADTQSLDALMTNMRDLTTRVRSGRFRARELSDATVTLTSLGERGTDVVFGVIYPPQVAIVGMGVPRLRPTVVNNEVVPRLMTTLSIAADHRVSDGQRGALFLRAIDKLLQHPERL